VLFVVETILDCTTKTTKEHEDRRKMDYTCFHDDKLHSISQASLLVPRGNWRSRQDGGFYLNTA